MIRYETVLGYMLGHMMMRMMRMRMAVKWTAHLHSRSSAANAQGNGRSVVSS